MIVEDLIRASLRLLGIVEPSSEELCNSLDSLNSLLKSLLQDRDLVYVIERSPIKIYAGFDEYPAPNDLLSIEELTVIKNGNEYQLHSLNDQEFANFFSDSIRIDYPVFYYHNEDTIQLRPIPNMTTDIYLYYRKMFDIEYTLTDTVDLPDGWPQMLKYSLALQLAPEYGKAISTTLRNMANAAKLKLRGRQFADPWKNRSASPGIIIPPAEPQFSITLEIL